MLMEHAADPDTLVHEWAEAVIGDQYPVPDRILHFTELIVQDYLAQEMCDRRPPKGTFDLFATCLLYTSMPDELHGIVKCANPKCITNNEPMATLFHVIDKDNCIVKCHYCEKEQKREEISIL